MKSRRKSRGAVIVESLVVTPLFIILCSMAFYAFRLHHENLVIMKSVREPLETQALGGCQSGSTKVVGPPSIVAGLFIIPETLPGGPNQDILIRPLREATNSQSGSVTGDSFLNQGERKFQAKGAMMCNEPVEDGQLTIMRFFAAEEFP